MTAMDQTKWEPHCKWVLMQINNATREYEMKYKADYD